MSLRLHSFQVISVTSFIFGSFITGQKISFDSIFLG